MNQSMKLQSEYLDILFAPLNQCNCYYTGTICDLFIQTKIICHQSTLCKVLAQKIQVLRIRILFNSSRLTDYFQVFFPFIRNMASVTLSPQEYTALNQVNFTDANFTARSIASFTCDASVP
jgi:hypothetical protein